MTVTVNTPFSSTSWIRSSPSVPMIWMRALAAGVTFTVNTRGVGSRSNPPLAVPPLSCTWKVKLAYGVPLAWVTGVNTSRPASMSPTLTNWPAVTTVPLSLSAPAPGSVVIRTACSWLAGLSWGSVKPKSPRPNT